jgi:hypothetical protein
MSRHVVIGRLGPTDKVKVPVAKDETATAIDFLSASSKLDHGIGSAIDELAALDVFPSEIGVDLLVLAAHVHLADTRISRASESQDSWTREIRLVVPVSAPARWRSAAPVLRKMLDFLTGDRWIIDFRPRPSTYTAAVKTHPEKLVGPAFKELCLFSGGLDSLIGAIDLLENGQHPLFISHAGEGSTSNAQEELISGLKSHYKTPPLSRIRMWMSFPKGSVDDVSGEMTTRSRSFLFFSLGVMAGTGLEKNFKLWVPENGLIALNVPLDPLRLGSNSTRTTHPFYIARWNELLGLLDIVGSIENRFWNKTKGEMASECANQALLKKLVPKSLSCSSATKGRWQGHSIENCGFCLPCLIRRAALNVALGKGADKTIYTIPDLRAHVLDTRKSEGKQVRSFQLAISRLKSNPALAALLIHKPGPLSDDPAKLPELAAVYRRGLEEVGKLLAGVSAKPS